VYVSRLLLFLLPVFGWLPASAQDLSGTWEGETSSGADYMKLVIVRVGGQYVGYTYDSGGQGSCKANFAGTFSVAEQRLKGGGKGMIRADFGHMQCNYNFNYYEHEGALWLEGTVKPKGAASVLSLGLPLANVTLKRVSAAADTTRFMQDAIAAAAVKTEAIRVANIKPDTAAAAPSVPALTPLLALKKERRSDVVQEISTSEMQIRIRVYDNGLEDGDTVSILHNDIVLADHRAVTVKGFELTVTLDSVATTHDITLIAHNLGSIAPNSASLVIEAGTERYRLTTSTDLERNAVIRIRYRKP
jgi:hypothetical protein